MQYRDYEIDRQGHLLAGGLSVPELAREYGTPLYILDAGRVRSACRAYVNTMKAEYAGQWRVAYASKALCFKALYALLAEEGMSADVVSGGELYTALQAGFPADRIYFHGNNKTVPEIKMAIESGVNCLVIDNAQEPELINRIAAELGRRQRVSFRIKPGIDAHTHDFIKTGKIDSKFGLALETGEVFEVMRAAAKLPNIELCGIHCHIGSQIFDAEPFEHAAEVMLELMARLRAELGADISELNLGGGFGIAYIDSHDPRRIEEVVRNTCSTVAATANKLGLPLPLLILEPGRSITGPAGLTVYTVGSVKNIPGVRTYVSVDGGMTDNPRYALYGAAYDAVLPERASSERVAPVTLAGRLCESGDILIKDIPLPEVKAGDYIAVLATGAYNYSMASNYNRVPRPPIVMVEDGKARLAVRRESYEDLVRLDMGE